MGSQTVGHDLAAAATAASMLDGLSDSSDLWNPGRQLLLPPHALCKYSLYPTWARYLCGVLVTLLRLHQPVPGCQCPDHCLHPTEVLLRPALLPPLPTPQIFICSVSHGVGTKLVKGHRKRGRQEAGFYLVCFL